MDLTSSYIVCERDVAENNAFGATLLVPTTNNAGIFELNEMSARIWATLKEHSRLEDACKAMITEVETSEAGESGEAVPEGHTVYSRDAFTEDFLAVVTQLQEIGAIQVNAGEGA